MPVVSALMGQQLQSILQVHETINVKTTVSTHAKIASAAASACKMCRPGHNTQASYSRLLPTKATLANKWQQQPSARDSREQTCRQTSHLSKY
jgi:hypothetical protein